MKVGFTGTRHGMTAKQQVMVSLLLGNLREDSPAPHVFMHGDCIGADEQAHKLADDQDYTLEGFPPDVPDNRAFCGFHITHTPAPYLQRDRAIVDACHVLIATPRGFKEELRSGTWTTVRYARKLKRSLVVVWPDGTTTVEGE